MTNAEHYGGDTPAARVEKNAQCNGCSVCRLSKVYNNYALQPFAIDTGNCFSRFLAAPFGMPLNINIPWNQPTEPAPNPL